MISEENNNVMCKNKSKQEMGDRKTKLNHSPSTTSIGSIDLSTFATDPQNDDRDFQNRSPIYVEQTDENGGVISLNSSTSSKYQAGWFGNPI